MDRKITIGILIGAVVIGTAVSFFFSKEGKQEAPLEPTSVAAQKGGEATIENADWSTYKDDGFGVIFRYPNGFSVSEDRSAHMGDRLLLVPTGEQGVALGASPKVSISDACLVPENVSRELWQNGFLQPLTTGNPFHDVTTEFIKTNNVGQRTWFVFKQGCSECYDGWNQETAMPIPHPERGNDGFAAYSCERGTNRNGNEAARCVLITTERRKIGSAEFEALQGFFLNDFLPRFELGMGSRTLDCEGVGESAG